MSRPVCRLLTTVVFIFTAILCNKWWGDPYSIQSSLKLGKTKQLAKVISNYFLNEHWTCLMNWDVSKGIKPSALWRTERRQGGRLRAQQLSHLEHTCPPRHAPWLFTQPGWSDLWDKVLSARNRSPVTTRSSRMEEGVDKSEAQSALRVVQAVFASLKKKKKN